MVEEDINVTRSASLQGKELDRTDLTDDLYHARIADVRSNDSKKLVDIFGMVKTEQGNIQGSKSSKKLVDIFGMRKTEQETLKISVDAYLLNINGFWSSDEVQIHFVKSDYTQLGSCAKKIRQTEDPTFEPDGLKEATYLRETIEVVRLRDNTDTANGNYSTALVENKKKRKDIAEDGLQSTKEESIRNVCINFVCVSGK